MHPLFVATGPAFKKNYTAKMFNNTDIYVLMCTILGLQPAQHNGSFDNIKDLLVDSHLPSRETKVINYDIIKVDINTFISNITTIRFFLALIINILLAYYFQALYFVRKKNKLFVRADHIKHIVYLKGF